MKKILFFTWLCLGATFARADAIPGNRFLFIVQVSRETRPQMTGVRACLSNLFETRFTKQLHNGDSFGIWTFDDNVHAGNFPMQIWDGDDAEKIIKRADDFLKKQASSREARLNTVLPPLLQVVEDSETLTVLLFTDGYQELHGTPFDNAVNRAFTDHRDELRKAGTPFATVLQARDGKILHSSVNSAAAPLMLAAVPSVTQPKPLATTATTAPKKTAAPKVLPSLILDYSKSNAPAAPPPTVMETVTATPVAPGPVATPVATSTPPPAPVVVPRVEPKPVVSAPVVAPAPMTQTTPTVPAPTPVPTATVEPVRPPVSYPPARLEPALPVAAPVSAPPTNVWPLMFGAGLVAGLIVAVAAVWFFTRGQRAPRRSVITESLERRDQK